MTTESQFFNYFVSTVCCDTTWSNFLKDMEGKCCLCLRLVSALLGNHFMLEVLQAFYNFYYPLGFPLVAAEQGIYILNIMQLNWGNSSINNLILQVWNICQKKLTDISTTGGSLKTLMVYFLVPSSAQTLQLHLEYTCLTITLLTPALLLHLQQMIEDCHSPEHGN